MVLSPYDLSCWWDVKHKHNNNLGDNNIQNLHLGRYIVGVRNHIFTPGGVAQPVTCLATDAKLIADPGVASSIPVRSHTFVEIDHEIISTVILLLLLIHS